MTRMWLSFIFFFLHIMVGCSVRVKRATSPHVEYQAGTLNVILSAPHGGVSSPSSIPDRTPGCWNGNQCYFTHECGMTNSAECPVSTVTDGYTKTLADIVRTQLLNLTGKAPHLVKNLLRRRKMDANREKDEATLGVQEAEDAWDSYQGYIQTARASINGRGLFVDIHGHGHQTQWTEIGYRISRSNLNSGTLSPTWSSVRNLHSVSGMSMEQLIRGDSSFGQFLNEAGYRAVPSPQDPSPGTASYFSGGYLTKRYGSRDGGEIDAIQIEAPSSVRFSSTERNMYGRALASAIKAFLGEHY